MKPRRFISLISGIALLMLFAGTGNATAPVSGEEALFVSSTQPDALIVLDLSGSMAYNPAGGSDIWGNSSCSGPFHSSSGVGHNVDCSRLAIAKRAIFKILDDTGNGTIDSQDEGSLGIRMGYMRLYDCCRSSVCGATDANSEEHRGVYSYTTGCNQIPGSSNSRRYIGSKYSQIYCNSNTSCTVSSTGSYSVGGAAASGGTPAAVALHEAKTYLDVHKAADAAAACRKKFVIFITDGADTYVCGGNGQECQENQYKRRREVVARTKALADAGYKVFVIGFGAAMPDYQERTLNWMAYYGGTDNPNQANTGSVTGFTPDTAGACTVATDVADATCEGSNQPNFKANTNDPGYAALSGYAFLAADADQVSTSLQAAINIIREATYSFSQASIQSSRTADENFVYEGSFQPINGDPFWFGHLRKYAITTEDVKNAAGVVISPAGSVGAMLLDAGTVLQSTSYTSRNIYTCVGCTTTSPTTLASYSYTLTGFSTSIVPTYFGLTDDTFTSQRDAIVGYIQGNATYNPDNWKLGDVFRSTPITVGTPSAFFDDFRDTSSSSVTCCPDNSTKTVNAFGAHRCTHCRTSAIGNRLIVSGANDGQFHAFKTSDMTEAWSFVPPNLLSKLKNITHAAEPTALLHQYFVDGPVSGADVWLGSGTGTSKSAADWKTLLVFGEGRGSTDRLWSSAADCASGLSPTYSATYPNYCGYYALDLNDSLNPRYMWRLNGFDATTQAPYMGESWSKMFMGRILTKSGSTVTEKWVGFLGAGYNANACPSNGTCDDKRGKGFYVVDLSNGQILWSFTHTSDTASNTRSPSMRYSFPAPPSIVDSDNDGFIDTAYIGDLGGNMWRFKFCTRAMLDAGSCGTSDWQGTIFVDSSSGSIRPIHTGAAVARDALGNMWVFYGTGDKVDPTASNAQEYFYAVKDIDRTSTINGVSSIDQIVTASQVYDATNKPTGYRISLPGSGQKILAEPTVFGGVAYFTSFTPGQTNDPCNQAGVASLNAVNFTTGAGVFNTTNPRQMDIGTGIASAPILSLKPTGVSGSAADLYVTVSGGGASSSSTQKINFDPPGVSNRTNMIYWKDRRIE
ncbi:MAG: hypothetical protein CVU71_17625 [Deltaproteobacteria bacterium HGW-Deltaproteobacteria-6]|nr:MAG: hypothetical protein CVU71_17625 [Deltaproteobacteria bacterium HGW-Deltaproteobacteria-6]